MSLRPDVSVIMPCHNAAATLNDAITSVRIQDFRDWELICVDDRSSDATPELLVEAAHADARVRVLRADAGGASAARNCGVRAAQGRYLFFLDADDRLKPAALRLLMGAAEQSERPTIVTAALDLLAADGCSLDTPRFLTIPDFSVDGLLRGNNLVGVMVLTRRGLLEAAPFDESLPANEDWDLWLRLAQRGVGCAVLPRVLLDYRLQPESLSRNIDQRYASAQRVVRRWLPRARNPRAVADAPQRVAVACGALALARGDADALTRYWRDAARLSPPPDRLSAAFADIVAACLHWAYLFIHGAHGHTWTTRLETWLAEAETWLAAGPLAPLADTALPRLRELACAPSARLARIRAWLDQPPDVDRLVIYGVGANGLALLDQLRRARPRRPVALAVADDYASPAAIRLLELPRVDPRHWSAWPAGTRAVITPNVADSMRYALERVGGRAGVDFLTLADCPAPCPVGA
jgi:glycosyltransferase involved in cell wall biosynthesis